MQQLLLERLVDLATKPCDGDVDHVVQGRGPRRYVPHVARKHFTGNDTSFVSQEVLEDFELLHREIECLCSARGPARHEVHLEILVLKPENLVQTPTAHQGPDARKQLGK